MLPYFGIFIGLVAIGFIAPVQSQRTWLLLLVCIGLVFFMGTRFETGCDYLAYKIRFDNATADSAWAGVFSTEPVRWFLIWATKSTGLGYVWHNVIATMVIVMGYFVFARQTTSPLLYLAIIFPICIVQLGMSGIRQALALTFLMMSLPALIRGNRITAAILIGIGGLSHTSVLAFMPVALLAGSTLTVGRGAMALIAAMPILFFGFSERIDLYSSRYIEQVYGEMESNGALLRYFFAVLLVAPFPFARKRLKAQFPILYPVMQQFFLITLAAGLFYFVSTVILHRFVFYLIPFNALICVQSLRYFFDKNQRQLAILVPVALSSVYMFGWFYASVHADRCFVPYQSFLTQSQNLR